LRESENEAFGFGFGFGFDFDFVVGLVRADCSLPAHVFLVIVIPECSCSFEDTILLFCWIILDICLFNHRI